MGIVSTKRIVMVLPFSIHLKEGGRTYEETGKKIFRERAKVVKLSTKEIARFVFPLVS